MSPKFLASLCFMILIGSILSKTPSFSLNFTEEAVMNIKNQILPTAISKILSLPLPDISQKVWPFTIKISNLKVSQLQLNSSDIVITLQNNEIFISVQHVAVKVEGDLEMSSLLSHKGTLSVDLSEVTVSLSTSIALNQANKFEVSISNIKSNIGDFKLLMSGSFFIDFIDLLVGLFKGLIQDQVQTQIQQALQTQVPTLINQLLATIPEDLKLPIPPVVPFSLHLEPVSTPKIEDNSMEISFYGYIFDYFMNRTEPPIPEPSPFVPSIAEKQIQITISQYIVNSIFNALVDADVLSYVLITIPGTNYSITTDYVDYFLPGIADQYGKNNMVIFFCSLPVAPELDFLHPVYDVTLEVNATCDIQPVVEYRPINVGKLTLNLNVSFDASINNGMLSLNPTSATCQNLDIIETNFTNKEHLDALKETINLALGLGVIGIKPTIAIPTIQGISFNDTQLIFGDGFIQVETSPDLTQWTPSEEMFTEFYNGFTWVNFLEEDTFRKFLDRNSSFAF